MIGLRSKKDSDLAAEPSVIAEITPGPVSQDEQKKPSKSDSVVWPSASKPSAVLVPQYIRDFRALARTRRLAVVIVGAIVLIVVSSVAAAFLLASSAKSAQEVAEAERDAGTAQVAKLAEVAALYDGLEIRRSSVRSALAGDMNYYKVFGVIADGLSSDINVQHLESKPGEVCPGPDPFNATDTVGCVTIQGSAGSPASVGRLIDRLNKDKSGLITGALATSIEGKNLGETTFAMTLNYTPKAYSYKYTKTDGAEAPATPATTPAASPAVPTTEGN